MSAIHAVVRNGRIETDEPIELPEGTRLDVIPIADADVIDESDTSPEGIARWLEWSERPPPSPPSDLAAILTAEREARKQWEREHWDEYTEKLRRIFE